MRCVAPEPDHVPGRLRRGMCERHYRRFMATGSTAAPVRVDDLSRYTIDPSGCWLWDGTIYPNGYGKTAQPHYGTRLAHRVIYLASGRTIPDGLDLDHVHERGCRHRHCVNPDHLEPVTRAVNISRGFDARPVCRRGHDLTDPANIHIQPNGVRLCAPCWRIRYRAAGKRYRDRKKTFCIEEKRAVT